MTPTPPAGLPHASTAASSWKLLDPLDRPWCDLSFVRAYFGVDLPPVEHFRRALRAIALASPQIGRWTGRRMHWRPVTPDDVEQWLDLVIEVVEGDDVTPQKGLEINNAPLGDVPMHFQLGTGWFSIHMSHGLGDGQSAQMFISPLFPPAPTHAPLPGAG